jgi:hypothetical protein
LEDTDRRGTLFSLSLFRKKSGHWKYNINSSLVNEPDPFYGKIMTDIYLIILKSKEKERERREILQSKGPERMYSSLFLSFFSVGGA